MWVVVVAEAAVIALLAVLVIGLLRSNADIVRRLDELQLVTRRKGSVGGPSTVRTNPTDEPADHALRPELGAPAIIGETPDGESTTVAVGGAPTTTLVAFLSSGCLTCDIFWNGFARGIGDIAGNETKVLIVTKGAESEQPERVAQIAPAGITTLMSSAAWDDYDVPISPYFVCVDGPSGEITVEGAAASWEQLLGLLDQR